MSTEAECNIAAKYRTVRKHLDTLGYKQALSLDALPLIEKLLADLVQTTESLKYFKTITQENVEAYNQLQLTIDPYKCDNARLAQECNQLHLNLIEVNEARQKEIKDLKKQIYNLECEYNDVQVASSQNLQKIKELEIESSKKSKKILELQGKCLKPIINNVGLANKKRPCYPLRRPILEAGPLPKAKSTSLPISSMVEPNIIDLISMADHRINSLSHEITKLKEELSLQTDNVYTLQSQLSTKEKEIMRLQKVLESSITCNAASRNCFCKAVGKDYDVDDINELKILQQAKLQLEQQLKEALNKQHDAMSRAIKLAERNEELEKELKDVDYIALSVEADCNSTVKENNRRVCKLQEKLENMITKVHLLENKLEGEHAYVKELKVDLDSCRLEKHSIQRKLEFALDEKKEITDKINQLTLIEKSLNDEIERLIKENERQRQDIIQLHYSHKILKEQLQIKNSEQYRNKDDIKRIIENEEKSNNTKNRKSSLSPSLLQEEKFPLNSCSKEQSEVRGDINNIKFDDLQRQINDKDLQIVALQQAKEYIETERDFYKNKYNFRHHDKGFNKDNTTLSRLEYERDTAKADVQRLIEERDALHEKLKETRQATVNNLEEQLEDTREELKQTKQELVTQRTQYFQLRALQDQTDQVLGDVQTQLSQSETELNKVIDRNKIMEQQQKQFNNQIKELKQEINTLRSSMAHLDHEKDQVLIILDEKTEEIAALERELKLKDQHMVSMEQQVQDLKHKNEICIDQSAGREHQLRSMQLEIETLERQLKTATVDRETAIQENRRLQDDLAAVTCEVRNLQRDLESSRAKSYDLKRQLQTYVSEVRRAEELLNRKENERTEMLNHFRSLSLEATVLENNNHSLESEAAEAKGALQTARDQLLDLERQLADRDCLIRGYETQISELTQSIASMETQLHQQCEYRQRAEVDLNALRDLCVQLDRQKDTLEQQLGDKDSTKAQYETQLARLKAEQNIVQDQLARDRATVNRLESLLDQARQESINVQATNQELQNEISRLKQKISELQDKLDAESMELKKYQNQAVEYDKQISELRRQVTNERFDRARKEEETRRSLNSTPDNFNVT